MIDTESIRQDTRRLRRSALAALCFIALIWLIWLVAWLFHLELRPFGVYPRHAEGLVGILVAPLIHGSFAHVFANTLPVLILGTAFLYTYPRSSALGLSVIYLGSGLGVWLFARRSVTTGEMNPRMTTTNVFTSDPPYETGRRRPVGRRQSNRKG